MSMAQGSPVSMQTITLADKLRLAAAKGQLEVVQELVAAGAGFQSDKEGRSAIHFAALSGYVEVCKFLLDHGCNVDEKDLVGNTALHRASSQGHVQFIELLLEKGCDTDSQDENGNAAVHEAAWHGFSQTLELMIKHDCDIMAINKAGFSALHLAAQNGHNQSTRVLLLAGCNADMKNNYGDTALHTAARYGHAGVTRILISARCCLNEQNKNGDTALHIASALKRRKIAKLLVDAGVDALIKNKQFETALEVAQRKEHPEIALIITSFARSKTPKPGPHKSVNFKEFPVDLEGPVVVPDEQAPVKTEKQEKKFFDFFKKKKKDKDKDKSDPKAPQPPNQTQGGPNGNPSVQGFFSQYVPKPGYQYFRDLAGNIKQGPIGYTPVCQCMPTIKKLEHQVYTNRENLYDHIQASNRAINERLDHIDKKTSQQVGELDRYTKERLGKEEDFCKERLRQGFEEEHVHMQRYRDGLKTDIQDLLEAKLGMYGHCLDHHHDDTALPNNNIFTDVHETENGRLFRSRSDETLSQSDNHSGKFRKKEFYETRQQAMQQIRAWQMPTYNRDTRDRATHQRSVGQNNKDAYGLISHVPNRNEPIRRSQQYIASKFDLQSPSTASTSRTPQVLSPADLSHNISQVTQGQGAIPKRLPPSQTWHNAQQFRNATGTANRDTSANPHSTPKHRESSPSEMNGHGQGMVRSHTESDGLSHKNDQSDINGNRYFNRKTEVRQSVPERGSQYFSRTNEQRQSFPERGFGNINTGNKPTSCLSSKAGQGPQEQNRPSSTKPEYQYSVNQPTFTTFGYDGSSPQGRPVVSNQSANYNQTPVSSASHQRMRQENPYGYLPNRSRTPNDELSQTPSYSVFAVKYERSKTPIDKSEQNNSRISNGGSAPNKDDLYISMSQRPVARQRTRSSDALLVDDELTSAHDMARRSISEERVLDSPVQRLQTPRSSSETRPSSVQNKSSVAQSVYKTASGSGSNTQVTSASYQSPRPFYSPNYNSVQDQRNVKPGVVQSNQGETVNRGTRPGTCRSVRTPTENMYASAKDNSRGNVESVNYSHSYNLRNVSAGLKENGYRSMRENPYASVREVSHRANSSGYYPYTSGKQGVPYHSTYNVSRATEGGRNAYPSVSVTQSRSKSESNLDRSANDSDHDAGYTSSVSPRGAEITARQTPVDNTNQNNKDHLKVVANYPNAYGKEDSSSNPDSGYSSKIFGNRTNVGNIPSNSGTPSSSFSTDHDHSLSISSNNNSPHPQVSHSDYELIQNVCPTPAQQQQGENLQSHVQNWYQRKLKEAAQRYCDSPYNEKYNSYQNQNYAGSQYAGHYAQSPEKYHNPSQYSMHMAHNNSTYTAYQHLPSYVRGSDV